MFDDAVESPDGVFSQAVALLQQRFDPVAILLYGSYARGQAHAGSDIDLAIFQPRRKPDIFELNLARIDLEDLCRRSIDLVILDEVSPILAMQILRNHRLLALQNRKLLDAFVVKTLTDYADLKIVRRPIEEALLNP
ncbi:MAG: nucleotidyltransferase domain-containing protein [Candidatus Competibacteraceae bacterium]